MKVQASVECVSSVNYKYIKKKKTPYYEGVC